MNIPGKILNNIPVQQYGKAVRNSIHFHLASNQHLAITGESGSGEAVRVETNNGLPFFSVWEFNKRKNYYFNHLI